MASTTVGLVYSKATGRIRSIVVPGDDAELVTRRVHPGENTLVITLAQYAASPNPNSLQVLVNAVTGLNPTTADRAVFINNAGFVQLTAFIDQACGDGVPSGLSLAFNDFAMPGWHRSQEGRFFNVSFPGYGNRGRRSTNLNFLLN
jgi:hypothetical protein